MIAEHPAAQAFAAADVDACYRVIAARRDVRNGFLPDPVSDEVLTRVLAAAHQAPSVGLSSPWDFIVLRDRHVRERVPALANAHAPAFASSLPESRGNDFSNLKVEAALAT